MTKLETLLKYKAQGTSGIRKLLDTWAIMGKNFINVISGKSQARTTRYFSKDMLYILNFEDSFGNITENSFKQNAMLFCIEEYTDSDLHIKWENLEVLDWNQGYISFGHNIWDPHFRIILAGEPVTTDENEPCIPIGIDPKTYKVQVPSFVPFTEDEDEVKISDADYQEIMSCLGIPFIQEEALEYNRTQISNLAIKPALREFFHWIPAVKSEVVQVSRAQQKIPMPPDVYGVAGLSLQQNGMNAMGDTTSPFAYAWEQSYYGGNGINVGLGLMNTSIKGVATNGITQSIQSRALAQAMINYTRRVHYEGPYEESDGSKYIVLYSNTQGAFNIWWARYSMDFNDVPFVRKTEAIDLSKAKVKQLFGEIRRQSKSDIPGLVDYKYLIEEGKTLWDDTVKKLMDIVKAQGIMRGSLG